MKIVKEIKIDDRDKGKCSISCQHLNQKIIESKNFAWCDSFGVAIGKDGNGFSRYHECVLFFGKGENNGSNHQKKNKG